MRWRMRTDMNRGHYVYFRNLTDAVELKELNDVLNDMLKIMWEKLAIVMWLQIVRRI